MHVVRERQIYVSALYVFGNPVCRYRAFARTRYRQFKPVYVKVRRGKSVVIANLFAYLVYTYAVRDEWRSYKLKVDEIFSVFKIVHNQMIAKKSLFDNKNAVFKGYFGKKTKTGQVIAINKTLQEVFRRVKIKKRKEFTL